MVALLSTVFIKEMMMMMMTMTMTHFNASDSFTLNASLSFNGKRLDSLVTR